MSGDVIQINRANCCDQIILTMQLCSAMLLRKEILTCGEMRIISELVNLIEMQVNMYAMLGLPSEREYWKMVQKKIKDIMKESVWLLYGGGREYGRHNSVWLD